MNDQIQIPRALLAGHIAEIDNWNASMAQILGRQPEHQWVSLEALRAALSQARHVPGPGTRDSESRVQDVGQEQEFQTSDSDLTALLNIAADLVKANGNMDLGLYFMEVLERVEQRLAVRPAQTEQPANFRKARCINMRPGMGEVTFYVERGVPSFMDPGCTVYVSDTAPTAQTGHDTFCVYCGGNDEEPQGHCMDCTRPIAQTEQSGITEAVRQALAELDDCDQYNRDGRAAELMEGLRAALSAQGGQ